MVRDYYLLAKHQTEKSVTKMRNLYKQSGIYETSAKLTLIQVMINQLGNYYKDGTVDEDQYNALCKVVTEGLS